MDARATGSWPYATSPGTSWSSEEGAFENSSKRSSAALSGCSDDPDSPSIGTDFTRDFYRLVKFESTKSLASTSSRSGRPPPDREQALQSVLSFIAEQQMYLTELPNNLLEHNGTTEGIYTFFEYSYLFRDTLNYFVKFYIKSFRRNRKQEWVWNRGDVHRNWTCWSR